MNDNNLPQHSIDVICTPVPKKLKAVKIGADAFYKENAKDLHSYLSAVLGVSKTAIEDDIDVLVLNDLMKNATQVCIKDRHTNFNIQPGWWVVADKHGTRETRIVDEDSFAANYDIDFDIAPEERVMADLLVLRNNVSDALINRHEDSDALKHVLCKIEEACMWYDKFYIEGR